ncbi:MAG TPA: hypothetical protein VI589_05335, partial [Vicinamibacteria bacterium]
ASGLVAGLGAAARAQRLEPEAFPPETALGALGRYISGSDPRNYAPTNIAFGLLPELPTKIKDKARRRLALAHRALESLEQCKERFGGETDRPLRAAASGS